MIIVVCGYFSGSVSGKAGQNSGEYQRDIGENELSDLADTLHFKGAVKSKL